MSKQTITNGESGLITKNKLNDNFTELYTGAETVAATDKATPVDADVLPVQDSAASNIKKKVTWANIKATLKTYQDTLYATAAQGVLAASATQPADIANFETTTQLNTRDTNNRARANHTGSQLASTISDFSTAVSGNAAVVANTAKATNAIHTGDVTGSGALTIAAGAVDIAMLSASGTADGTTFLRGDNTWAVPGIFWQLGTASTQLPTQNLTFNFANTYSLDFINATSYGFEGGNVGIGIVATSLLQVHSSSNTDVIISNASTSSSNWIAFNQNTTLRISRILMGGTGNGTHPSSLVLETTTALGRIKFETANSVVAGIIDEEQKWGIGTLTPTAATRLDVVGINGGTNIARFATNGAVVALLIKESNVINTPNMPTSASGLSAGDLWNNSGIVTIV